MFRTYATALAVAGALFLAGAAGATEPTVVDQYTEQVPTPGGEKPAHEVPSTPDTAGSDGSAAVAAPTGGSNGGSGGQGATTGETASGAAKAEAESGGPVTAGSATNPDTGSAGISDESDASGMGLLFPLILVACLVAVAVIFFMRRRGDAESRAT